MNIRLNNLIPRPIAELHISNTDIWELDEVVFTQGETYLIKAQSGRGKTSFIHTAYGIRKDYTGNLFFNDTNTTSLKAKDWSAVRQTKLSIVFQGLRLFPELTALENILLKNELTQFKTEEEIIQFAKLLNMDDHLNKSCSILSYGQQQRIAIIRALCQPFEFLLLDEPFGFLDTENKNKAIDLVMHECLQQKAGLIITSLEDIKQISFTKTLYI